MNIRYRHLRDSKKPARVMTVVTRLTGDLLEYGFHVNTPPRFAYKAIDENSFNVTAIPGKQFCRKLGRTIALGRMDNPRTHMVLTLEPGQNPYKEMLVAVSRDHNVHAASIARQALRSLEKHQKNTESKVTQKDIEESKKWSAKYQSVRAMKDGPEKDAARSALDKEVLAASGFKEFSHMDMTPEDLAFLDEGPMPLNGSTDLLLKASDGELVPYEHKTCENKFPLRGAIHLILKGRSVAEYIQDQREGTS